MLTDYQKSFLAKIISVPSVGGVPEEGAPYGKKPREVLDVFLAEAKDNGFRTGIVGDRAGWVEFGSGEKLLGIICHLDVVPVTDDWDSDPFILTFREEADGEVMYARGIVDDKGPACASFFAMKELFDQGHIPANCRVRLILGTDEERTCSCIQYYAAHGEVPDFSITPDSVFPVVFSEKGILQLRIYGDNERQLTAHGGTAVNIVPDSAYCVAAGRELRTVGKAAHASKPGLGHNAIMLLAEAMEHAGIPLEDYPMMRFIREFALIADAGVPAGNEAGELTFNMGLLNAGGDGCELRMDFRIPASMDVDGLIRKVTERAAAYGLQTEVTLRLSPMHADRDSTEIGKLAAIWQRHMDRFAGFREEYRILYAQPTAVGVGTYARHIPNTIAFGIQAPWQVDQCHQVNEHATVSDFMQWIAVIKEYITEFVPWEGEH